MYFKKENLKVGGLIYMVINVLYLIPIVLLSALNEIIINNILAIYIISLSFYFLFYLPYLHILFCIVLTMYCILKKTSFKKTYFLTFIIMLSAIDIIVNIYWAFTGRSWVIQ